MDAIKYKYKAFKGIDIDDPNQERLAYGVCGGGIVYDPQFTLEVANLIAELENGENPPIDWYETEEILIKEGLLDEVKHRDKQDCG